MKRELTKKMSEELGSDIKFRNLIEQANVNTGIVERAIRKFSMKERQVFASHAATIIISELAERTLQKNTRVFSNN